MPLSKTIRAYLLEVPYWVVYINDHISVKNNTKRSLNLTKEEALNTVIGNMLVHLFIYFRKSEEKDSFLSQILPIKVLDKQRGCHLFKSSYT